MYISCTTTVYACPINLKLAVLQDSFAWYLGQKRVHTLLFHLIKLSHHQKKISLLAACARSKNLRSIWLRLKQQVCL